MLRRIEIIGKEIVTYGDKRLIGVNLGFIRNDGGYQVDLSIFYRVFGILILA